MKLSSFFAIASLSFCQVAFCAEEENRRSILSTAASTVGETIMLPLTLPKYALDQVFIAQENLRNSEHEKNVQSIIDSLELDDYDHVPEQEKSSEDSEDETSKNGSYVQVFEASEGTETETVSNPNLTKSQASDECEDREEVFKIVEIGNKDESENIEPLNSSEFIRDIDDRNESSELATTSTAETTKTSKASKAVTKNSNDKNNWITAGYIVGAVILVAGAGSAFYFLQKKATSRDNNFL